MSSPLPISVVVPAYNAAATLAAALASVGRQTRAPLETIVLDDGSTDATVSIARERGARVISQRNGGLADARNVAIRAAAAPWIALLDADDVWHPEKLERQWALHERLPEVALLASDYTYLVGERITESAVLRTIPQYRSMARDRVADAGVRVAREALVAAIVRGNFVLPSSLLVERRMFLEYGEFYCERERLPNGRDFFVGEDYEWLLRVLRHTDVAFVEGALVDYRRSASSLSADGGRLRYGDVKLGELVCASPERYARGAAAAFARVRPTQLAHAGSRYLAVGDIARAHAMFAIGARDGDPGHRALSLATAPFARSAFGRAAFEKTFAFWRTTMRPLLARLRRRSA